LTFGGYASRRILTLVGWLGYEKWWPPRVLTAKLGELLFSEGYASAFRLFAYLNGFDVWICGICSFVNALLMLDMLTTMRLRPATSILHQASGTGELAS
jgi:hypothetical protein